MTTYNQPHVPKVRIETPEPDRLGMTPAVFTKVTIDGEPWAIVAYEIKGRVDGIQHLVLEFLADVTVTHPDPKS